MQVDESVLVQIDQESVISVFKSALAFLIIQHFAVLNNFFFHQYYDFLMKAEECYLP